MSLALLLEKYDVSTDEGLQRALNEIEKEELEVDEALENVLSRACTLEDHLRTASQAYNKLGDIETDAQAAAGMVDKTAALAKDVSAKVRQLDLARSRVAECQRRVHDLIDLQLCSAGVEAAIKAHDYETGAAHVARFLSMDPGSVAAARARGPPGAADPRRAMAAAAGTLREHLVRKFEEAARKEDEAAVERLFKLFPQIGRAEEGVTLLAKYLATQAEASIRRACAAGDGGGAAGAAGAAGAGGAGAGSGGDAGGGPVFADALTRLLEAAAAVVEKARRTIAGSAPGHLPAAIALIQPLVCVGARRLAATWRGAAVGAAGGAGGDPRTAEPALDELARAHSTIRLYFNFLLRKTEQDAASLSEAEQKKSMVAIEKIIAECDLTRTAQDLLGHYLSLERYYLEESVNKALKMSSASGATSSSLVDDVFFIARKVIRRAVSSGSLDGLCAVLNEAAAQLELAAGALRRRLRSPPPEPLPLPPARAAPAAAPAPASAPAPLDALAAGDDRAHAPLFLAHTNEAEAGAEWAERLAGEAVARGAALLRAGAGGTGAKDEDKLRSCAAGLGAAAAAFRAAHELALAALRAALRPRTSLWADIIADPTAGADPEDVDDSSAELVPCALETLSNVACELLSPRAADSLLTAVVTDIATRAEARMLHHTYDREGGARVERRARRLAAWAGGGAAGARERAARLASAAALLALERAAHAPLALAAPARLPPAAARALLARRTDFKIEEIKRLKL